MFPHSCCSRGIKSMSNIYEQFEFCCWKSMQLIISPLSSININILNMLWQSLSSQESSQNVSLSLSLSLTDYLVRFSLSEFEPLCMTYLSKLFFNWVSIQRNRHFQEPIHTTCARKNCLRRWESHPENEYFSTACKKGPDLPTSGTDACNYVDI